MIFYILVLISLALVTARCPEKCICSDGYEKISCLSIDTKELNEWVIDGSKTDEMVIRDSYVKPYQVEAKFPKLQKLIFTNPRFAKEKGLELETPTQPRSYSSLIWYCLSIAPILIFTFLMGYYDYYVALRQHFNELRFYMTIYRILRYVINWLMGYIGNFYISIESSYIINIIIFTKMLILQI